MLTTFEEDFRYEGVWSSDGCPVWIGDDVRTLVTVRRINYCGFFESLFKNIYEMHSWSKFLGFTLTEFWRRISLGWCLKFRLVSSVNWRRYNNVCRGVMCYVLPVLLALLENIQGTFALPLLLPPHFQNLVGDLCEIFSSIFLIF